MKKVTKEVKSHSEVVDTIQVPVYESADEAVKAVTPAKALEMINKCVSDALTNAARTAKVRPTSDSAKLARMAKTDPKLAKEIEKLLVQYQD